MVNNIITINIFIILVILTVITEVRRRKRNNKDAIYTVRLNDYNHVYEFDSKKKAKRFLRNRGFVSMCTNQHLLLTIGLFASWIITCWLMFDSQYRIREVAIKIN